MIRADGARNYLLEKKTKLKLLKAIALAVNLCGEERDLILEVIFWWHIRYLSDRHTGECASIASGSRVHMGKLLSFQCHLTAQVFWLRNHGVWLLLGEVRVSYLFCDFDFLSIVIRLRVLFSSLSKINLILAATLNITLTLKTRWRTSVSADSPLPTVYVCVCEFLLLKRMMAWG